MKINLMKFFVRGLLNIIDETPNYLNIICGNNVIFDFDNIE